MSSSQNSYESASSALSNTEDLVSKLSQGVVEVLVKGTICGMVHLLVFTVLKQKIHYQQSEVKKNIIIIKITLQLFYYHPDVEALETYSDITACLVESGKCKVRLFG
ncbi:unnamed protein product (macronuclear) [Paramecium tetraurelia]|uniref:Uncharacterized protein n=1 Tax=Paramecium tetraurelia TaxID=5888 RepID=A0DRR4_PARTE|nr:uncharacterized protein GSPATT00019449001 [Paramecium tetraurelia]CAK85731.1 unnamed protein product [Paramecium tetraurelia]|eukprot:XP_001453128.1 hypothetical protein (macronuclear) [Paramecium tetraurelia strain d4-2]